MTLPGRREFLKGGLAVGALSTQSGEMYGALSLGAVPSATGTQVASFGWEAIDLHENGANTQVKILSNMVLQTVNADISAAMIKAKDSGFAEVLCTGGVSRQAVPSFNPHAQSYVNQPTSPHFGSVTAQNAHKLSLVMSGMVQDQFLAVILKTWVPADGAGSATARHVLVQPSLKLSAGDYLVFHMDHSGVSVDAEMQIVITYTLT